MATNQNRGNQLLTVDFKLPLTSQRFNEFLRDMFYPGIYKGIETSIVDVDTIQISPGIIWFNAESGAGINVISVKVRTQSAFELEVEPANPVLYTRLTWANVEDNYAEFDFAPDLNSLPTNALVVAELLFDGGNNLVGVDYSNRTRGTLDWNSLGELTTILPPSEDWHVGNEKWNRDKYLRYVTQPINGNRLITSISSNATISGNTTVYESNIIITGNNVIMDYNVEILRNLTVQGTTTTINSQTLEVEDKNITIAKVDTPTDTTADGGGITLLGATNKTIDWTQSGNQWNSSEHWNLAIGKEYRINGVKVLDSNSLGSGITSAPGLSQVGTITGGTWEGDVIATSYGGTGQSSYSEGEILIGKTNGSLAKKTIDGTPNQVNVTNGDGTITLSTPQDIHTGASPTFSGLNILGDITTNDTDKHIFNGLGAKNLRIANSNSTIEIPGNLNVSGNSVIQSLDVRDNFLELNKITSPTNVNADGGGLVVKGTTDKTFTYDDSGSKYWESSENINLVSGKSYFINGVDVMAQALAKQDNLTNPYAIISSAGVINNLDTTSNNYVKLSVSTGLTGIVAPTGSKNVLVLTNTNSSDLIVSNESGSSSANNRIITGTGSNLTVASNATIFLLYDIDSSRWRIIGGSGGGGGSDLIVTAEQTSNYISAGNEIVICNTLSGEFTVTLPPSPTDKMKVVIVDAYNRFSINNLVVARNGNFINNSGQDVRLKTNNPWIEYTYIASISSWYSTPIVPFTNAVLDNYVTFPVANGDPINNGYERYNNSPGNNPVSGRGGIANITWTKNTSTPLSGEGDFLFTKDASNRQGEGASIPFSIEDRHLASVLQISGNAVLRSGTYTNLLTRASATYSVTSNVCTVTFTNTFNTGTIVTVSFTSGGATALSNTFTLTGRTATTFTFGLTTANTSGNCEISYVGDLRVSVVQDPNGTPVVLEPVGTDIQLATTGLAVKFLATFQTDIAINNYQLCFHVSGSTANAFTVSFSNIRVWEQEKNYGAIITEWQAYTPTFVNFGTSPTVDRWEWRRVGENCEIRGRGANGSGSMTAPATFILPNGLRANNFGSSNPFVVGNIFRSSSSENNHATLLASDNSNLITVGGLLGSSSVPSNPFTAISVLSANDPFGVVLAVPIQGWGSNMALSSDAGSGKPVSGLVTGHTGISLTADVTNVIFNTIVKDSHGIYNTSTGNITIPESGDYNFVIQGIRHTTGASYINMAIWVGSSKIRTYSTPVANENISAPIVIKATDLRAGDVVSFRIDATRTSITSTIASISWEKSNSGSQILARDEVVACSYYSSANQVGLTTQINFGVRVYDTHNAVTTGASWRFTTPVSGIYRVSGFVSMTGSINLSLFKGNSLSVLRMANASNGEYVYTKEIFLLAGEFIDLRPGASSTVLGAANLTSVASYIDISRIG